jgi:uncharacterized protein (TIGR02722 family)
VDTGFGASDLQQVAEAMVDSLLIFPPVVDATTSRRPVLTVDRVKNKTMQHIDTESITDSIRVKLIHSGRFRFIDRTTDDATIDEIKTQLESGLVDKKTARRFGKQIAPEYMLTANLSEINQRGGGVKDVYYKFTMSLKNLQTGVLEWSDEKELRKQSAKALLGW